MTMRTRGGVGERNTACDCLFRRRKDDRPGELIQAAQDVFVEKGFAATRLDEVAEKAGVSKGTIYLYFRNKEALFKEVIQSGLAPAVASVAALAAETDRPPAEQLRRFLEVWQRVMCETPLGSLLKLLAAESGNFPEVAQWFNETVVRQAKGVIIGIVEAGIASGEFRPIRPEIVADIFASPLCLYALSDIWGELASPDLFLGSAFEMLTRGLGEAPCDQPGSNQRKLTPPAFR